MSPLPGRPDCGPLLPRVAAQRQHLARFAELVQRAERVRLRPLRFDELCEFGALYRRHTAALAAARERGDDPAALHHLNALCVRAHTALFSRSRRAAHRPWRAALRDALGQTWRAQLLAWALLGLGLLLGLALAWSDPRAVHALVPESMGYSSGSLDRLLASPSARQAFLTAGDLPVAHRVVFGSLLFSHNTQIGLLSFATGVMAALPTSLLQLYNGLVLGAFASIFLHDASPLPFLAWILPHGIPELTAICLCCAAGLQLGLAIILPGRRSRTTALRAAVAPALVLFTASLPLFLVAAGIESFVRPSSWAVGARLAVAGACLLGTLAVLMLTRRAAGSSVETTWLHDLASGSRAALARTVAPLPAA